MLKNKKISFITAALLTIVIGFGWSIGITHAVVVPVTGAGGTTPTTTNSTSTGDYCDDGSTPSSTTGLCADGSSPIADAPISTSTDCAVNNSCNGSSCTNTNCDLVKQYLIPFIDFLAGGVGLIVTIMIVIGGIQYTTSQDNPQAVSAAKNRIVNAIIALIMFGLMWSLLQWLVPGGIFNG
jgi:hypothetical protein